MRRFLKDTVRHRWFFPAAALLFTIFTAIILTLSIGTIRTRAFFDRTVRRIEILDRRGEYDDDYHRELRDAARYARSTSDWRKLLQLAWKSHEPERWSTLQELAEIAVGALPRDARWRIIGAYAAVRRGDRDSARDLIIPIEPAGETVQHLHILAALEPGRPDRSLERLREYRDAYEELDTVRSVAEALDNPSREALTAAWDTTGVSAFGINSALHAAVDDDREETRQMLELLWTEGHEETALLYLAAWLRDTDRLFRYLRRLSPQRAVEPEILLLQADAYLVQAQWREARAIYRELQELHPEYSAIPFVNDAVLSVRHGGGDPLKILLRGDTRHPRNRDLQLFLAQQLVLADRQEEAISRLEKFLEIYPREHSVWLMNRLLRARRETAAGAPPERLEGDFWTYLNQHDDAHSVAAFLGRLLLIRGNTESLAELRRRYPPETGAWAATLHLIAAVGSHRIADAEELLPLTREESELPWTGWYNRALFALQYLPMPEAGAAVSAFRTWWERDALLPPEIDDRVRTELLLLEAEYARLREDHSRARELLDRAISISPERERLYSYRTLLAPRD